MKKELLNLKGGEYMTFEFTEAELDNLISALNEKITKDAKLVEEDDSSHTTDHLDNNQQSLMNLVRKLGGNLT